ncbi:uncharacterized protein LOC121413272 isoform X4 [Lytechinus variegatus]|uniref:uncharacterized protein LOC121413272 isoform X4 n=1 Tax=Lytechinus variegatus TaxID=7654 RepID=UPI001BB1E9A1|nr:uncharacterized protein LOC121413272 isoform X4 [Lytechinus variegatus]
MSTSILTHSYTTKTKGISRKKNQDAMDHNQEKETEAMMVDDKDSGMGSTESGSRRDSLSSMASANSSATSSNDSAIGSMSDQRSSLSSNASLMSGMSDRSLSSRKAFHGKKNQDTMDHNQEKETEAMMVDDKYSGMGSTESGSRRDSLSSMASANSSATRSNDSAIGSMSDRRSSLRSNAKSMSGLSDRSLSSRKEFQGKKNQDTIDHNQEKEAEAMMVNDGDSGMGSTESGSRRDSLSSMASANLSATLSNDSAIGSMSDRRSSLSSNASSMSGMSDRSLSSRKAFQGKKNQDTMNHNQEKEAEAMMVNDGDSGMGSTESGSRRDSLSSMASANLSATLSNDSAIGSMSYRRSSLRSNAKSMSGMSDRSLSSRSGQSSDAGYPDSVSSSRRSSISSVRSDDSTTTIRSDATATSMRSDQTRTSGFNQDYSKSTRDIDSTPGHTRVRTPYNHHSGTTYTTTPTPRSDPTIEIMVGDFNGKTHIVRVRPTDTVNNLKSKIEEKLKVAPSQQQLTFQGRPLNNDASTVTSCGLQNLSTVQLQGRLRGGKDYMHRAGFV